jgi:hypothetical protein
VEVGTVADWIAAVGTVGALIVALSLLWREQRDRRTAQARLVSTWVSEVAVADSSEHPLSVIVQNRSNEPVYAVTIFQFDPVIHHDVGQPGELIFHVEVLPPDTRLPATDSVPTRMGHLPTLTLYFTDSAGHRWKRHLGRLARAAELEGGL